MQRNAGLVHGWGQKTTPDGRQERIKQVRASDMSDPLLSKIRCSSAALNLNYTRATHTRPRPARRKRSVIRRLSCASGCGRVALCLAIAPILVQGVHCPLRWVKIPYTNYKIRCTIFEIRATILRGSRCVVLNYTVCSDQLHGVRSSTTRCMPPTIRCEMPTYTVCAVNYTV